MRRIDFADVVSAVKLLCSKINYDLPPDVIKSIKHAAKKEENRLARRTLLQIIENSSIASGGDLPLCQDTGAVEAFVEIGQEVFVTGGLLKDAINTGVKAAYAQNNFRMSLVADPLIRRNTFNNTPVSTYFDFGKKSELSIKLLLKGAGAENSSAIKFFAPGDSWGQIESFILNLVKEKAPFSCPPVVVSIALGGNFSSAPVAAKKALFRKIGSINPNKFYASKEKQLLKKINSLGIGPMATGGNTSALAAFISPLAVHIASLPCAVTLQCHSLRRGEVIL